MIAPIAMPDARVEGVNKNSATITTIAITQYGGEQRFQRRLPVSRAAVAVRSALKNRGLPGERLITQGFGKSPSIAPNEDDDVRLRSGRQAEESTRRGGCVEPKVGASFASGDATN
jgi:hypothetical protein